MILPVKVILVTRNVRDCAVSYFHHNVNIAPHDFIGAFPSFAKMFRLGLVYNGSYWVHQRSFENAEGVLDSGNTSLLVSSPDYYLDLVLIFAKINQNDYKY